LTVISYRGQPMAQPLSQRFEAPAITVGRSPDNDWTLPDPDQLISKRHCAIRQQGGRYSITDTSTNGVFLNDTRVTSAPLEDGFYVRVGNCLFRFLTGGNVEAEYHEEIYRLTIIDGLTDIHNKRSLMDFLDRELARSERYGRPLSLVLFDIDRFKRINDGLGHLAGDAVLRELAACVKETVRKEELFARYGGEEFAVVLPETPVEDAVAFAERLREAVAAHPFAHGGQPLPVTVSVGVAGTMGQEAYTPGELIARADKALYQAKNEGRNCVRAWADDER
ncbi:MAG TPA: diguanylate cyclase, partial [Gemmataceae bacterium]|nr:diguanylate cyclase [Gemmataceae bacterium]